MIRRWASVVAGQEPREVLEEHVERDQEDRQPDEVGRPRERPLASARRALGLGPRPTAKQILDKAIPVALKMAKPGRAEFRKALRDAIEGVKDVHGSNGVYTMSQTDHIGLDDRASVMVQIKDGKWQYVP